MLGWRSRRLRRSLWVSYGSTHRYTLLLLLLLLLLFRQVEEESDGFGNSGKKTKVAPRDRLELKLVRNNIFFELQLFSSTL